MATFIENNESIKDEVCVEHGEKEVCNDEQVNLEFNRKNVESLVKNIKLRKYF